MMCVQLLDLLPHSAHDVTGHVGHVPLACTFWLSHAAWRGMVRAWAHCACTDGSVPYHACCACGCWPRSRSEQNSAHIKHICIAHHTMPRGCPWICPRKPWHLILASPMPITTHAGPASSALLSTCMHEPSHACIDACIMRQPAWACTHPTLLRHQPSPQLQGPHVQPQLLHHLL